MTIAEATNGRAVRTALPSFTFPDSGITVRLRRISPDTQARIAQALSKEWDATNPRPQPPLQHVETLDGESDVPNPEEPEYAKALHQWLTMFNIEVGRRLFELAMNMLVVDVDTVAVQQLRDEMAAIGAPFDDDADDREIYIKQVCISSVLDSAALVAYVQGASAPTKDAIQAALDMFQRSL
jgi:hypothetical protein